MDVGEPNAHSLSLDILTTASEKETGIETDQGWGGVVVDTGGGEGE